MASPQPNGNNITDQLSLHHLPYTTKFHLNPYCNIRGLKGMLSDFKNLPLFVNKKGFDIVHMNLSHDFTLGMIAMASAKTSAKLIYTNHHGLPLKPNFFYKLALKKLDTWIDIGHQLGKNNKDTLGIPEHKHHILPGAICNETFTPRMKNISLAHSFGIRNNDFVFGIVARLQRRRHFFCILKAIHQLKKTHNHFKFLFIGRGKHLLEMQNWVKELKIEDTVIFTGYRKEDYKDTLALLDTKIFLIPGFDGSCRAAMESMAMAKPLIVSKIGVLPELVEHLTNGYHCDIKPDSLCDMMQRMIQLSHEDRLLMGQESLKKQMKHHSLKHQVNLLENIYKKTLAMD
jgi:glycosyltransferase involved in cell wall biosynthesis